MAVLQFEAHLLEFHVVWCTDKNFSFSHTVSAFTVSYAADRSYMHWPMALPCVPASLVKLHSDATAVVVPLDLLKPNWKFPRRSWFSRKLSSCSVTTLSNTIPGTHKRATGR